MTVLGPSSFALRIKFLRNFDYVEMNGVYLRCKHRNPPEVITMSSHPVADLSLLSDEDRAVLAAQDMLVTRRRGPGRVVDTSGSFEEFSARMAALRATRRAENERKGIPSR